MEENFLKGELKKKNNHKKVFPKKTNTEFQHPKKISIFSKFTKPFKFVLYFLSRSRDSKGIWREWEKYLHRGLVEEAIFVIYSK